MTQSAVCPSTTIGFSPLRTQRAPLRRARARTVASGAPWPCSPRAMVPRRVPAPRSASSSVAPRARAASVAAAAEEKKGPGTGTRPICSATMQVSSKPLPLPPCSLGNQEPGPAQVDQGRPQFGCDAGCVVGQLAHEVGPALALERAACHLLEGHLFVVVREVHGLSSFTPVCRSLTRASQYTVGPLPLPPVDFALAPEDEKFRDELRAWLDEHLPPFLEAESLGDDAQLSGEASQQRRQKWQRKLHEGGWAAIHWGPDYANGRTINAMQRLIYSEVMAEYRTPGMFNTNGIWQIGPMIIQWGTDEQKAQWLPSILEAEEHWCQGFSEPMAGNDLANLRTTAVYDADTDEYVVNGSKIWISSAHLATWGLFLLRTDPTAIERGKKHEGITAFILNLKTPGIDVRPIRDMAGEELFNEIFFTDVRIPAKWRLGEEGAGWMVAMGTLGFERVGIASQIAILAADLRAVVEAAKSVNPDALDDPFAAGAHRQAVDRDRAGPPALPAGALQDHEG